MILHRALMVIEAFQILSLGLDNYLIFSWKSKEIRFILNFFTYFNFKSVIKHQPGQIVTVIVTLIDCYLAVMVILVALLTSKHWRRLPKKIDKIGMVNRRLVSTKSKILGVMMLFLTKILWYPFFEIFYINLFSAQISQRNGSANQKSDQKMHRLSLIITIAGIALSTAFLLLDEFFVFEPNPYSKTAPYSHSKHNWVTGVAWKLVVPLVSTLDPKVRILKISKEKIRTLLIFVIRGRIGLSSC